MLRAAAQGSFWSGMEERLRWGRGECGGGLAVGERRGGGDLARSDSGGEDWSEGWLLVGEAHCWRWC